MFRYRVQFWDEVDNKVAEEHGLACGSTYASAADAVVEYYGYNNIVEMTLSELDDAKVMTLDELKDAFFKDTH